MTNELAKTGNATGWRAAAGRSITLFAEALMFLAVLAFTAVTIIAIAIAAPLALAASALAGAIAPRRGGGSWRAAQAI